MAASDPVSLNFQNADIDTVIQAIGKLSGNNFLVDPRVKGKLNIVTNTPVAPDLAYQILLSALRLQGYTAVEDKGITKILPEADAKLHAVPVNSNAVAAGGGDRLVTQVFALHHESATQMVPVVRPLVAPNNSVTAFPSNNVLVVTDYASNIARIASVIESLDVAQGDLSVIALNHAAAGDLAPLLSRLLAERAGSNSSGGVQILAEPHSNSLLVRADTPSRIIAVRQLVANLDRPGAGGNIHVVYLKNADARQVAETLNATLGTSTGSTTPASSQSASGLSGLTDGSGVGGTTTTATGVANSPAGSGANAAGRSGTIQADPMNNALIINAPEAIYRNLRVVIDQLDRRRAQVYIEALIAEISTERAAEFGIQWAAAGSNGSTSVIGTSAFASGSNNLLQLATGAASGTVTVPGNGLTLAVGGGKVNIPGVGDVLSLGLLARFLENEVSANILSTPNIVTLDNEEAKIVVGRNVPFVTGQYTNTGSGSTVSNPFQTIERKDVGLTLKVRPQISEGGAIRLAIYQEASAVVGSTDTGNGPTTTKRSIESMVMVDDGAIIALGGLVEDSYSGGEEKVPMLGDLPVAGALFRYDNRKRSKTNLVVFLRPVILREREDYAGITRSRYDYVIGEQRASARPRDLLRGESGPAELPAFGSAAPTVPYAPPAPVEDATIRPIHQ
ncbi:type II secretion system secretin GspD [Azoarcus sp. L1K30]|uniref:type II secretion system secretin GspD n=1 Tax=Azoarcus sp. L1K30 TaxID=2820277 RepID=UPI002013340A|nr:type II secretion system secretin GspD [Azoarcus sp. L1K30]